MTIVHPTGVYFVRRIKENIFEFYKRIGPDYVLLGVRIRNREISKSEALNIIMELNSGK